jgi:hypothetical protein
MVCLSRRRYWEGNCGLCFVLSGMKKRKREIRRTRRERGGGGCGCGGGHGRRGYMVRVFVRYSLPCGWFHVGDWCGR